VEVDRDAPATWTESMSGVDRSWLTVPKTITSDLSALSSSTVICSTGKICKLRLNSWFSWLESFKRSDQGRIYEENEKGIYERLRGDSSAGAKLRQKVWRTNSPEVEDRERHTKARIINSYKNFNFSSFKAHMRLNPTTHTMQFQFPRWVLYMHSKYFSTIQP